MLENGVYDTDNYYPFYLSRMNNKLDLQEEFSYDEWCDLIPLLGIAKSSYYLFKRVWLGTYVRFSFLPSTLDQEIKDYDKYVAKKIIQADDLAYPYILKLKLAYVCFSAITVEALYIQLIDNIYVQEWLKVGVIQNLGLLWDTEFTKSPEVFDSILRYVSGTKYSLNLPKDIYYTTDNEQDFYNVFMFTTNCVNQDSELRFPITDIISTYQQTVMRKDGFPDSHFMNDMYRNSTLFRYLNLDAFEMLLKYTNIMQRVKESNREFTYFRKHDYYINVSEYITNEYKYFSNTALELFKNLYNSCKTPVHLGNMTFFSKGECDSYIDETVHRDFLNLVISNYDFEKKEKMIKSLYSEDFVYFRKEDLTKVVHSYVPNFSDDDTLNYIWLDAYIRYYYIPRALSVKFGMICDTNYLKLMMEPGLVFNKSLFTAVIHYCRSIFRSFDEDIDNAITDFYDNKLLQEWSHHTESERYNIFEDIKFMDNEFSLNSIKLVGKVFPIYKTSYAHMMYDLVDSPKELMEVVFKFKLFLDTLGEKHNLTDKGVLISILRRYNTEIVSEFDAIIGDDIYKFNIESVHDILEFFDLCKIVYVSYIETEEKCAAVHNKDAADLFFGER